MPEIKLDQPLFKRFYAHLNSAVSIVTDYQGQMPFAYFLKNYFAQHKKFGSKDRRQIATLCYSFFRLGKSYPGLTVLQKMLKGYQLSQLDWGEDWRQFFQQFGLPEAPPEAIFAFANPLSDGVGRAAFEAAHLVQPDLFLRLRPEFENAVINKLEAAKMDYVRSGATVRLPNSSKIEQVLQLNKEAVIQDFSSQRVGLLLKTFADHFQPSRKKVAVWDCCAASGGKSLLAYDILKDIQLTVSDVRPSILANLKKRFAEAGITGYRSFIADAAEGSIPQCFDLIIADVPCSGSGTWARTPEQLTYFDPSMIKTYAALQRRIAANAVRFLNPRGFLLYITCSVFAEENEAQVNFLKESGLTLIEQQLLNGYDKKADTMFAALLRA
ncbi:methyltransferase domain-containing protein [Niabella insulamsoli]|uniref:Fmu (Sun) domain protein n=1 Tax=Niabella insulamsoli TaxID=3144874 RepID=UPI0031FC696A